MIEFKIHSDHTTGIYLYITKGQDETYFSLSCELYKKITPESNIFHLVQKYINTLSEDEQSYLFSIYKRAFHSSNLNALEMNKVTIEETETNIREFIQVLDIERLTYWLNQNSNEIAFPLKISEEFVYDPDLSVTEDKTYVKRDYLSLVALVLCMRACFPLYIDYMNYTYVTSSTQFIYATFLLFTTSQFVDNPAYNKLKIYIEQIQISLGTDKSTNKFDQYVLNKGYSYDDINDAIIAEIFLNKLFSIDLTDSNTNIVSFVFQTIRNKSNLSVSEGDIIRGKKDSADKLIDEISYFEDYRKSSTLAVGTIAEIQYSLDMTDRIIRCIGMEKYFNEDQYREELKKLPVLINANIDSNQVYLLSWFMSNYIDPRSLFYIEKNKLIELFILAKVCLWNRGHQFISLLMTSYKTQDNSQVFINTRNVISKHLRDKLQTHYSFYMTGQEKENLIEKTIAQIATELMDYNWRPTAEPHEIIEYNKNKNIKTLVFPQKLADTIAEFVLLTQESSLVQPL